MYVLIYRIRAIGHPPAHLSLYLQKQWYIRMRITPPGKGAKHQDGQSAGGGDGWGPVDGPSEGSKRGKDAGSGIYKGPDVPGGSYKSAFVDETGDVYEGG